MTRYLYKILCILCMLVAPAVQRAFAQDTDYVPRHHLDIKPTTDFDQRFYYVPGERQNVWGYRAGVLINDKFKLGIGGYYMNQRTDHGVQTTTITGTSTELVSVQQQLYLGTVYYEPYLVRSQLWETSLVFETGYGRTVNATTDKTSSNTTVQHALLVPAGIGLSVNLKLPPLFHVQGFRWLGINAMGGYRTAVYQQDKQYPYNGAYWSLSGAIFLDRLFEDYRSWKKQRAAVRNNHLIQLKF